MQTSRNFQLFHKQNFQDKNHNHQEKLFFSFPKKNNPFSQQTDRQTYPEKSHIKSQKRKISFPHFPHFFDQTNQTTTTIQKTQNPFKNIKKTSKKKTINHFIFNQSINASIHQNAIRKKKTIRGRMKES